MHNDDSALSEQALVDIRVLFHNKPKTRRRRGERKDKRDAGIAFSKSFYVSALLCDFFLRFTLDGLPKLGQIERKGGTVKAVAQV